MRSSTRVIAVFGIALGLLLVAIGFWFVSLVDDGRLDSIEVETAAEHSDRPTTTAADSSSESNSSSKKAAGDRARTVVVRVVDELGRAPEDAVLDVWRSTNQVRLDDVVEIDEDRFLVHFPADDDVLDVGASAPGYVFERVRHVVVGSGETVIELGRGLTLSGQAVNRSGKPIDNVIVTWRLTTPDVGIRVRAETVSDRAGRFSFDGVASKWIEVSCSHPDYDTTHVAIYDVARRRDLRVVMLRPGAVAGAVIDAASGAPVVGAAVSVWLAREVNVGTGPRCERHIRRFSETTTDSTGAFVLRDAPAGTRDTPVAGGSAYVALWIDSSEHAPRWIRLADLLPGHTTEVGPIKLYPFGAIRGRVVDRAGRGVPGLTMQTSWRRKLSTATSMTKYVASVGELPRNDDVGQTDHDGRYVLKCVATMPTGSEAFVEVATRSDLVTKVTVMPDIEVVADDIVIEQDVDERHYGLVVAADTKAPLAGATVSWPKQNQVTDASGRFSLSLFVAPSQRTKHELLVGRKGHRATFVPLTVGTTPDGPQVIELTRLADVTGIVVDRAARPVPSAEVRVFDGRVAIADIRDFAGFFNSPKSQFAIVRTDLEGRFKAVAPTGRPVHIVARVPGTGVERPRAVLEGAWPDDSPHTVRFDEDVIGDEPTASREVRFMSRRTGEPIDLERPVHLLIGAERRRGRRLGSSRYEFPDCPANREVEIIVPADARPAQRRKIALDRPVTDIELTDRVAISARVTTTAGSLPAHLVFDVVVAPPKPDTAAEAEMNTKTGRTGTAPTRRRQDIAPAIAVASLADGRLEVFDLTPGRYSLRLATEAGSFRHAIVGETPTFDVTASGGPATGIVVVRLAGR